MSDSGDPTEEASGEVKAEVLTEQVISESGEGGSVTAVISESGEGGSVTAVSTTTMASSTSVKLSAPAFGGEKSYEQYMMEVDAWCAVQHSIPKKDQAVILALSLPDNDSTGVKDKLFHDLSLSDLNCDNGVETFKAFMENLFKKDDLTLIYERYTQFEQCKREGKQTVEEYILEFDRRYKRAEKKGLVYPDVIKAFKLLDNGTASGANKMITLTAVDFNKKDELYSQMQAALRKFHGEQVGFSGGLSAPSIKLEPTFFLENEEALLAAGYVKRGSTSMRGRGSHRGGRGGFHQRGRYNGPSRRGSPSFTGEG